MLRDMTKVSDDEPPTFSKLGLAAALILNRIRNAQTLRDLTQIHEQQDKHPPGQPEAGHQSEKETTEKPDQISARVTARIGEVG